MFSPRWKKVIADLWQNKARTVLVVISIAIGVFAFGGLFIARSVLNENLDNQYRSRNPADIVIGLPSFDGDLERWAERQDYVLAAETLTAYPLRLVANGQTFDLDLLAYRDYDSIDVTRIYPTEGNWPPERDELWIERGFLERVGVPVGTPVQIKVGEDNFYEVTLAGLMSDLTVSGGSVNSRVKGFVNYRTLASMGLSADYNRLDLFVQRAEFGYPNAPAPVEIADQIRKKLLFRGVTTRAITIDADGKSWAVDILNSQTTTFTIIGLACLLLSSSLVANIISGLLAQQKRQIGVLKIIGGTRGQIVSIYLAMVFIFGLLALLIALPMSINFARGTATGLGEGLFNFDIANFRIPPEILILEIAMAFAVPMIAAIGPILSGTRITPAEAISDYNANTQNSFIDLLLSRLGGLPSSLLLSLRNTFRKKGRLLATAVTLAFAGVLFMSIVNVRTSLQVLLLEITQLANFDVRVSLTDTLNKQGLEQRVLELPDVVDVEGWLTTSVRYLRPDQVQSDNFVLTGLPAESIFVAPQPMEGRWLEPYTNDNRYDIVVTREVMEREPSIQVGRPIMLRQGGEEEMFRVVGMVEGGDQFAYGHYETVSKFAGAPDEINSIILRTTDNSEETHNRVASEVADYFDLRDYEIASSSTGNTFRRDLGAAFDIFAFTLLGVSLLIAIVAGLGLAGTMSLNVLERTREIGVLRSIGAATNTIRVMYVTEGFLVGLLSFVLAVPFVPLVTVILNEFLGQISAQRSLPYATSATGIAIWFGLVTMVSILSSVSPAQRASQISIREALSYE